MSLKESTLAYRKIILNITGKINPFEKLYNDGWCMSSYF